jgi:lambda family phage tail tape measure protein
MAKQQTTDVKVRLLIEGFEGLDKIKSSFRDLGKVTNLAEKDILKARASLLEIAKESGNTEAVTAGLISAFKGLRTQTDQCGDAYKQLSADLRQLNEVSRGATDSLMAQRQAVLSTAAATTQNAAALTRQRDALVALRAQTRESSQAFEQFSGDIQQVEARLENLAEVNRRFNRAVTQGTAATAAGAQVSLAAITQGISLRRAEIAAIDLLTKEQRKEAENVRERIRLQRSLNIALTQQGILQFQESARAGRERVRAAGRTFNSGTLTAGSLSPEGMADRFGLGGQIPNTTAGLNQELSELGERLINTYRHTENYLQVQLRLAAVQREAAAATQGYGAALRAQLDAGTLIPSQKNLTEVIGQLRREMLEVDTTTTEGAQAYANNATQANQLERQLRELASAYRQVGNMATTAATAEQNAANARIRNNYLNRGAIRQQEQALRELGEQVRQGVASTPLLLPAAGQTSAPGTGQARSGGARNRLVDAAVNEFVDGVEATFSESLARRLKTAGERSGYYRPPTAAVGVEPAVGFAPGAAQAFDNLGRSTDRARRPLREVFAELQRVRSASNGSVNSLQAQINSWTEIRSAVSSSAPVFAKATRQIEILSKQRDRLQVGGGRRLTGMQTAQGVGAAISGGIFGGPEGLLGGLGGLAVGGVGGAFAGAAAGAQVGMFRQQIAATGDYAASIGKMQIALRGVAGSQSAYDTAIRAAAAATRELNIPQEEATRGLTRLSAAVLGAGGTMGDATFAFRSISEAIKATGGNAEQVDGALLALTQVFSKGKVSAEELNQIAERLPGTFTLFAQAAGKTGPELQKALQQGEVGLVDLMKFLDLAGERFGGTALKISGSSEEAGARLTVAFQAMRLEVGRAVLPLGAELQESFADFISSTTPAVVAAVGSIASSFQFLISNDIASTLSGFALKLGAATLALKAFQAAAATTAGANIIGALTGVGTGFKITGDYAKDAVPKVNGFKTALTGLGGVLKSFIPFAVFTITVDVVVKGYAQLLATRDELKRLREAENPVPTAGQGIGPKLVLNAERRYTGASREKVLKDQQAQQDFVTTLRNKLKELEATQSEVNTAFSETALGGIVNIGQGLRQENIREEIELLKDKIRKSEEVLDLDLKSFKTQAQLDAARRKSIEERYAQAPGGGEEAEKRREKLRDAFNKREDAMLEAREQREEKLADIRVQAAEQAKQIEQDLADTRRSLERELQDMARNRAYSAEDSERRIRALRGEDSMAIDAEQRIADAYRKSREDTIAIERRFSDEEEGQDRKIAEFQQNIAKGIREANDAHTKKMGDIQKQYAKEVAKIVEKGGATSGKSIEQGGTNAAKQLALAAKIQALTNERGQLNLEALTLTGKSVTIPNSGLPANQISTSKDVLNKALENPRYTPENIQYIRDNLQLIDSIDAQLKTLNKQLDALPKAAPAAGPSSSAGPNRRPNQNGPQSSLPGEVPLSFDVSKIGPSYEDVAGLKPLPIQRMQQQAARPFLELWKTWETFSDNIFGPSKEEVKRVTKPDPARNKQVLTRVQQAQTAIDNFDPIESKWKEIQNQLREVKRSKPATMSAASLAKAVEDIYANIHKSVRKAGGLAVKQGQRLGSMTDFSDYATPQQSQVIGKGVREVLSPAYDRSVMYGGDVNAFNNAVNDLAPVTRRFGSLIQEVLQIEARKGYAYAEKALPKLRLAPMPAARPEDQQHIMDRLDRILEQPTIIPGIQKLIEGASLPGASFDVSKIATDFGKVASATFMEGLLAQGYDRPVSQKVDMPGAVPLAVQDYVPASVAPAAGATTEQRGQTKQGLLTGVVETQVQTINEAYANINAQAEQTTNSLGEQLGLLGSQRKYLDEGLSPALSADLGRLDELRIKSISALDAAMAREIQEAGNTEAARASAEASGQAELARIEQSYQANVNLTRELEKQNNLLKTRQDDRIGLGMQEGVQSYLESIGTMRDATQQLTVQGIKGLEDSIFDLVTTGTTNFREFAANMLRDTARMIIQQLVLRNILRMVQNIFSPGGFANGGVFGPSMQPVAGYAKGGTFTKPMVSTYAKGGMFDEYATGGTFAANKITPFAKGSAFSNTVVSSPTLFKFAAGGAMQTGLMGEAGPEAVMPLKRGPDGRLGVTSNISGANTDSSAVNNVTVNVDASGSKVQGDSNKSEQLGRAVSQAVQEELVRQKLPGGLLS